MNRCFVNSMPKSGTNLLARFLTLCGMKRAGHINRRNRFSIGKIPLLSFGYPIGIDHLHNISKGAVDRRFAQLQTGEFLTAHVGHSHCFLDLIEQHGVKPVLVIRDPRAVLNSFVHYVATTRSHPMSASFRPLDTEARYLRALKGGWTGKAFLEPLVHRCRSLTPWMESPHVLLVRFEDLVGESGGGSKQAQTRVAEKLADHLSIPSNRWQNAVQDLFGDSGTFRSGQVNSWQKEIPQSMSADVDAELEPVLDLWGYERTGPKAVSN